MLRTGAYPKLDDAADVAANGARIRIQRQPRDAVATPLFAFADRVPDQSYPNEGKQPGEQRLTLRPRV